MAKLISGTRIYGTAVVDTSLTINGGTGVNSTSTGVLQLKGGIGVWGSGFFSDVVTATTFIGNLTGTATQSNNLNNGTAGQLVYQSAPNTTAFAGPGTAGQVLTSNGTSGPVYVNTSTLYVGRALIADSATGGAGTANNIAGGILGQIPYQLGPSSTAFIGTGTNGSILQMGANTATFVTTANIYINRSVLADNLSGGATGGISYQTGANASTFLGIGSAGQVLRVNSGGTAPEWVNTSSLYAGAAISAQNLFGGTAGQLVYQSGAGVTAFAGPGTAGQLLVSNGTSGPVYTNTSSIQVGFAANLLAGAAGSLPYQSAANATAMLGIGASNSILVSNGSAPSWTVNPTIGGNVTIVGNLTVQGTTTQVDSTVTNISDPIITIGLGPNGAAPITDDGKDRGIAFAWTGTQAGLDTGRTGFFGFDRSTQYFTFITSASITNEVVAPAGGTTRGAIDANLAGGTAGQLVYQSAADTTAFAGPGTAGQVLTSNGTSGPVYVTTTTLYVGRALFADNATGTATQANNLSGGALGQIPYQLGANSTAFIGTGTNGSILVMGANTASFVATSTIYVNRAVLADNLSGGATGGISYQTGANASTFLGIGSAGQILRVNSGGTAPEWINTSSLYAGAAISAQNLFGGTAGQLVYQSGAGVTAFAGPGTAGQILLSNGTSGPVYTNTGSVYVGFSDSSNNVRGGVLGQLVYQTGPNTTAFIGTGTNGSILQMGANTATFVTTASIYVNSSVFAEDLRGGTAGQLVYQSAADTTAFAGPGTAGQVLTSNGTSGPVYVNTTTLYVGRALVADSASGTAGTANNIAGGALGQIPYQLAAGSTAFIGTGTNGSILQMGANTATFVATSTIYVNRAVLADNDSGGAAGGLRYQTGANASTFLSIGTAGQILRVNSGATAPEWINTSSLYSGAAISAQNLFGGTAGQLVYQSAAGTTAFAGPGTAGQILLSNGTSGPVYTNTGSVYVGFSDSSNNVRGGVLGQLVYQTGPNTTAFIGTGTNGSILQMGANTATFVTTASIYVNSSVFAEDLRGGTAGQLVYQSAANTTDFVGPGTAGQVLTSNGTSAPVYVNTTTLYVGRALVADSASGTAGTANNIAGGALGQIPYQLAAGSTAFIGTGTNGSILQMGANTATFVATSTIYVNRAVLADNDSGGAAGGLRYQTGANASTFLSIGTAGQILRVNSGATAPEWINTSSLYSGAAISAQNLFGGTAGQLVYQSAAGTTAFAGPGTAGQILLSNGTSGPVYTNTGSVYVGFSDSSNNVRGGVLGQLVYQTGPNTTAFIGTGTNGSILQMGANTATFVTTANIYVNSSVFSEDLRGGTAGQLVYQSAADTTAFAGPGTAGQVLTSNGTSGPVYVNTTTLYVGRALIADTATGGSATANSLNGGILGQIPYQLGPSSTAFIGTGTQGALLQMGANTASFITSSTVQVGFAANLLAGAAGSLPYQSAANATAMLALSGTSGALLTAGASAPAYITQVTARNGTGSTTTASGQSLVVGNGGLGVIGDSHFADSVRIGKALTIDGQTTFNQSVTFNGTATFVYSTNTFYTDNIINLHTPSGGVANTWTSNDGKDIGLTFHNFVDGYDNNAFIGWNNSSGYLEWWSKGLHDEGGVFTGTQYGIFRTGGILLQNTTGVHNATSGALQVVGGVGIGGNLFVAGTITATNFVGTFSGSSSQANNLTGGALGQIPYQLGANSTAFIGTGTQGSILQMGANTATFVTTANIFVNSAVNAINLFGGTAGQLHYQSAPGVTAFAGPGTAGQLLTSGGTSAPTYVSTGSIYVGFANQANNLLAGTAGQLVYQSAAGTTAFAGPGTAGQILLSNGTSGPVYTNTSSVYVNSSVFSEDLRGGTAGQLVYQSAANTTDFVGPGTAGQVLTSGGTGAPTYVTTTTLYVGRALVADSASGGAATANNIAGGILGQIPYQLGPSSTAFIGTGTQGSILQMSANTATFVTTANIYVNSAVNAQTIFGGTAGQLHYQSGAGVTAFAGPGSVGQVLISGGTGAPNYQSTLTVNANVVTINSPTASVSTTTGGLQIVNGGIGVGDSVYVKNRVGFVNNSNVSAVYQVYNQATNSLDTIFA